MPLIPAANRLPEERRTTEYQTRLRNIQVEAIRKIVEIERQRNPKVSEARVVRGLLRLGVLRYQEIGRIPELDT